MPITEEGQQETSRLPGQEKCNAEKRCSGERDTVARESDRVCSGGKTPDNKSLAEGLRSRSMGGPVFASYLEAK